MKKYLKTKYIYFLLPLTYVYVSVAVIINYILLKDIKKSIKTLFLTFGISILTFILPQLVSIYGGINIYESSISFIYLFLISTIFSIYIIRKQEEYINGKTEEKKIGDK